MPSMTFIIPDERFQEFKEAFILMNPIPIDAVTEQPAYTENEWIREWVVRTVKERYTQGKEELARRAANIDDTVIS